MNETKRIEEYFQRTARDFDAIYAKEKPLHLRIIDKLFRKSMFRRFELTLAECEEIKGKSVLDIGCGSGRYAVALAKMGAALVLGIDFSANMLELAKKHAAINGVSGICRFILTDFLTYDFQEKFDYSLAVGVLEYFKDPQPFLEKAGELTRKKIIFSLPNLFTLRSLIRKIRLGLSGQKVYFYTERKIAELLKRFSFRDYKIINLGRDFLVVIYI